MRISDWSSDVCSSDLNGGVHCNDLRLAQADPGLAPPAGAAGVPAVRAADRAGAAVRADAGDARQPGHGGDAADAGDRRRAAGRAEVAVLACRRSRRPARQRSEEHTSELQSLMRISYAVFCLNKKTKRTCTHYTLLSKRIPNTTHKIK